MTRGTTCMFAYPHTTSADERRGGRAIVRVGANIRKSARRDGP